MSKKKLTSRMSGEGLRARALRSSAFTLMNVAGSNLLRLASNLVLTRLLFPEAFGMMALVQVFVGGLQMFSDIGLKTSIIQHARGDEPAFLNTAWTLQILRGLMLWLGACALAVPAAKIYGEPMLTQLLPVAGLSALINGFTTTNIATANRHLKLGRQTLVQLGSQVLGIILTMMLAWIYSSVWSLVIGGLIANTVKVMIFAKIMPGIRNRLYWDRETARELINFGQYIFLATIAGYAINQGDRAILGAYIPVSELGIYSIGYFLGTVPFVVAKVMANKVILPLYRLKPPGESTKNRAKLLRARRTAVIAVMGISVILAFGGDFLVSLMYDNRYDLAGPMVVLFSFAVVPQVAFAGYDAALLANGDSKRFFFLLGSTALMQTLYLFIGITWLGIFGAILAPCLAAMTTYPLRTVFTARYAANDTVGDLIFLGTGFAINGFACWLHWNEIVRLIG